MVFTKEGRIQWVLIIPINTGGTHLSLYKVLYICTVYGEKMFFFNHGVNKSLRLKPDEYQIYLFSMFYIPAVEFIKLSYLFPFFTQDCRKLLFLFVRNNK